MASPLADIEDAILHMDGFSLGDEADSDLFEGHIKVLRKMRAARGKTNLRERSVVGAFRSLAGQIFTYPPFGFIF